MGLIRGSASFTRFFVNGKPPENYLGDYLERITRFSFHKLDEYSDEERSTGWVNIMNIFDNDFSGKDFFMHPYIALSWRIDTRKVPRDALNQQLVEAEQEIKENEELEYLPKERRRELKDFLQHQLLKRAIPKTNTYDMVWNLDSGIIICACVNAKLCDEFAEIFLKTFEIPLGSMFPYSLGAHVLGDRGMEPGIIDSLTASNFIGDGRE
ncbi:recombination-associated protein RdgC [Thermodesulfobacteriota bacterium]